MNGTFPSKIGNKEWQMMKQIVWITGASSGLGRELALQAAQRGMHVVMLARNEARLTAIRREIESEGGTASAYPLDMSAHKTIEEKVPIILTKEGGIDVLINNAGFGIFERVEETPTAAMTDMFQVNVLGLMVMTKAILPTMLAQKRGHIINIASQAGKIATPKSAAYSASKHAVIGFTNGLRLELDETRIRVSSVNPGPIKTPFFDRADQSGSYVNSIERWMLKPEYVAKATLNLINKPKREVNLPLWMAVSAKVYQFMPQLFERIANKQFKKK